MRGGGVTPIRAIRIADELWRKAHLTANQRGETVSDAVRRFLERYTKQHERKQP